MTPLSKIPARHFERTGIFIGLLASATIVLQIHAETQTENPTSLSAPFLFGWLVIFCFWTLYGLRFKHIAMWLTNGIAILAQITLLVVVMQK